MCMASRRKKCHNSVISGIIGPVKVKAMQHMSSYGTEYLVKCRFIAAFVDNWSVANGTDFSANSTSTADCSPIPISRYLYCT